MCPPIFGGILMSENKHDTKTLVYLTILQLLLVLLISYQSVRIGNLLEAAIQPPQQAGQPQPPAPTGAPVEVSADDDAVKGSETAPVTIIEFSDYQCPFCARFWQETLPSIDKEYIQTGKVRFIYRDYPLPFHPQAQPSAVAAECAGDQGKYWEMHDKIFENQASLSDSSYDGFAQAIGLNLNTFKTCVSDGKKVAEIQKDLADGQAAGVSGTPAFFVNGVKIEGAQPFSVFKQLIDAQLAK